MLFSRSEEAADAEGLGVIPGTIRWIPPDVKRPQMQWNQLAIRHVDDPMFAGIGQRRVDVLPALAARRARRPSTVAATCEYGATINAAFRQDNVFAVQFHPEKSSHSGLALLGNFVRVTAGVAA